MQKQLLLVAEEYAKRNTRRRIWRRFVRVLACIVVFCTTYALILPAITMERSVCELEEHTHSEKCYSQVLYQDISVLQCDRASLQVHTHTEDCFGEAGQQLCGMAEYIVHEHSDDCYGPEGRLVCTLPEILLHEHTEDCYPREDAAEEPRHEHTEDCYGLSELPNCGMEETEGHTHGDGCVEKLLICDQTEQPHTHCEDCYQTNILCGLEESEGHIHTSECDELVLECSLTEQPHDHEDGCYLTEILCGLEESEGHTHDSSCDEKVLTCDATMEPHVHADGCYEQLVCELPEDENHTHSDACSGKVLICDQTEQPHTHTDDCYQIHNLCGLEESEGHTHGPDCMHQTLVCDKTVEPHDHGDGCYRIHNLCSLEEFEGHTHGPDCMEQTQVCDVTVEPHVHGEDCYQTNICCELEETEGHAHTDACYPLELICELPEEAEESGESEPICGEEVIILHTHGDGCYEITVDGEGNEIRTLICRQLEIREHAHGANCFATVETELDTQALTCTDSTEGHVHGALCYGIWELTCGKEEHTHTEECQTYFCGMAAHSHSEECMDEAGNLICEMSEHVHIPACTELTEEEWAQIRNVIELIDGIPSADEIDERIEEFEAAEDYEGEEAWLGPVYQQVSRVYHAYYVPLSEEQKACVTNADKLLELEYIWSAVTYAVQAYPLPENLTVPVSYVNRRGSTNPRTDAWQGYVFTKAYVNSQSDEYFLKFVTATDTSGAYPYYRCHVIAKDESTGKLYIKNLITNSQLRTIVTNDTEKELVKYLTGLEGIFLFSNTKAFEGASAEDYYDTIGTTVEASFDWELFNTTKGISNNTDVHVLNQEFFGTINLNVIDANLQIVEGQSVNATVKLFNYDASINNSGDGNYYRLSRSGFLFYQSDNVKDGTHGGSANPKEDSVDGIGGRKVKETDSDPQGGTGVGKPGEYDNPVMYSTLTADGYPQANKGGSSAPFNRYFDGTYLKATMTDGGGLFRQDSNGYWYYDSKNTAASYNASTNRFILYNNPVSPSYLVTVYGRRNNQLTRVNMGNFLPFNEISTDTVRLAEPEIEYGKKTYTINTDGLLLDQKTYIALKEPVDLWFGMTVDNEFFMPKDGQMNGEDMVFEFEGDDDVFVYLGVWNETTKAYDYRLVLDIGGTHAARKGTINFATGAVVDFPASVTEGVENKTARNRTLKSIFGLSGNTFEDYTKLSMKFYYMERGGMISYCSLRFNMPVLAENSLSVTKELTSNTTAETLGNPDFRFQILKVNEDGTKTEVPFIGTGVQYRIYDAATNIQVGTGTTEANGVFAIKAGQRAEFAGIVENSGKYYVRELLDKDYFGQYATIKVDGSTATYNHDINLDDQETFVGVESPVKDASDGTTFFTFNNQVNVAKLGSLKISKVLDGTQTGQDFHMSVKLDGAEIPVGTPYTLSDGTAATVTTAGIIPLKAGQTATLDDILVGTPFEVTETGASAEGYRVTYQVDGIAVSSATGTVVEEHETAIVVTNVESAVAASVSGTKRLSNGGEDSDNSHEFSFTIRRTGAKDGNGNAIDLRQDYQETKTVTVSGTNPAEFRFDLNYVNADFLGVALPATVTYEIREDGESSTDAVMDDAVYTVTVTVDRDSAGQLTAGSTLTKNGEAVTGADFVNTLLGSLTLEKQVAGSGEAKETGSFDFTVWLGSDADHPLKNTTLTLLKNGAAAGTVKTGADGTLALTGVKHGDKLTLQGIPLGYAWRITETNAEGYLISWTKNGEGGYSNEAAGNIPGGGMEVVFTNTVGYELPQTGGAGTTTYTMAGLVLMCVSMVCLMYRPKARRKGASKSP